MQGIIRKNHTILRRFSGGDTGWSDLIQPQLTSLNGDVAAYFSSAVVSLFCKARIKSLAAVELPDIPPDASEVERLAIIKNYEWESPRVHLQIGLKEEETEYIPIWEAALLNQSGSPSYTLNCMNVLGASGDFVLGDTVSLGARIVDIGWGSLTPQDEVVLYGGAIQEAWQLPPIINVANQVQSERIGLDEGETHEIEANPGRKGLLISCWTEGGIAAISEGYLEPSLSGFPLVGFGAAYELNSSRLWRGKLYIEAVTAIEIEITEYF